MQQMALNTSMRTLTQQQQQQQQQQQDYQQQPGSLADSSGFGEPAAGSAVGQLLSKPTVMDAIKQVGWKGHCLLHSAACERPAAVPHTLMHGSELETPPTISKLQYLCETSGYSAWLACNVHDRHQRLVAPPAALCCLMHHKLFAAAAASMIRAIMRA